MRTSSSLFYARNIVRVSEWVIDSKMHSLIENKKCKSFLILHQNHNFHLDFPFMDGKCICKQSQNANCNDHANCEYLSVHLWRLVDVPLSLLYFLLKFLFSFWNAKYSMKNDAWWKKDVYIKRCKLINSKVW